MVTRSAVHWDLHVPNKEVYKYFQKMNDERHLQIKCSPLCGGNIVLQEQALENLTGAAYLFVTVSLNI